MKLIRPLLALVFVGLIALGIFQVFQRGGPDRPVGTPDQIASLRERGDLNVVVILVDTLRADRLSAWGYERDTSPVMDALAATGIRFANTLSQSTWTKTSMASMLTATYPTKNKITRFNHVVPEDATLVSEVFRDAGFHTVGIWRNGWVKGSFGFDQGWDTYVKPLGMRRDTANPSSTKLGGTDQEVMATAEQFLRTKGKKGRFYLYLHLMDVHQYVYDGSRDYGRSFSDIYDQSIHWVDANIGHLVAVLQREGLMKKTILAIVSDHGEAFDEHGREGHAANLFQETTHVPFILTLPFLLEQPIVVDTPVENVDVMPTILDLVGLPPMAEADGVSLVPLIEAAARGNSPDGAKEEVRFSFLDRNWGRPNEPPKPLVLVEREGFRLHTHPTQPVELFDANVDYGERRDVVADHPELVKDLADLAVEFLETPDPSWGGPEWVEIDEMEAQHLRALGYVIEPNAPPGEQRRR